ncbi:hypothetical protein MMC34_005731 [Xylographa carneopallida]|nr:hypothetical protein [Xylographa carneopallida]
MSSLTQLAEEILANAKCLDAYTASKSLPPVSFDEDSLADLPADVDAARKSLIDCTQTLRRLALGPIGTNIDIAYSATDVLSLRIIYEYRIPQAVPLSGSTTYAAISQACGLAEGLVFRFLRHAMANHIFAEAAPGFVRHTAFSRQYVADAAFRDTMGMLTCEVDPSYGKVVDALALYPGSGVAHETAYNLAHGTTLPVYAFLAQHPERARRFGSAMRWFTKGEVWDLKHLVASYDWAALDRLGAVLVDVGGGEGGVAQVLAAATQHLRVVVQDLPGTVEKGRELLPREFHDRIEFAAHDFYTAQPLKADAYFFRWIMHNYSDQTCVQILQALIPALTKGARVLVYEIVMPDEPIKSYTEKIQANVDLIMLAMFNACERKKDDWRKLFAMADERFVFGTIITVPGSELSVIEFIWKP